LIAYNIDQETVAVLKKNINIAAMY